MTTDKDFNLSEKINDYGYNDDRTPDEDVLTVEDVKEFIRLLKEELSNLRDYGRVWHEDINKTIDKLAGDELK